MTLTTNNREKELIKTEWGKRIEEVIFETGLSVRAFAQLVGYKHPSTFYAAIKNRKISPRLMSKIIDGYKKRLDKELNAIWLERGTHPKLLTTEKETEPFEMVAEENEKYKSGCIKCRKKDEEIKLLSQEIKTLNSENKNLMKEYNECLKEVLALKNASSG